MSNIEPLGRLTVLVCMRSPSKISSIQARFSVTPRMMPAAFLIVATNSSPPAWPDSSPAQIFSEIFLPFANFAALREIVSFIGVCRRKFYVARHKKIGAQELSLDYIGRHEDIQALQSGSTLSVASRASRLAP